MFGEITDLWMSCLDAGQKIGPQLGYYVVISTPSLSVQG